MTEGVQALEGSSILFSYQDGSVENVCISESDPSWSANIKRALVSMLQNKAVQTVGDATVMEVRITSYEFSTGPALHRNLYSYW